MADDYNFIYLNVYKLEWCSEVGQKYVNRNEFFSSDIWNSFKKNLDIPLNSVRTGYIRRKFIQNGTLLTTI